MGGKTGEQLEEREEARGKWEGFKRTLGRAVKY